MPESKTNETPKRVGRPPKRSGCKIRRLDFHIDDTNQSKCDLKANVKTDLKMDKPQCSHSSEASTNLDNAKQIIDYSIVTNETLNRKFPVKLMNEGVNVCFFNSICQILYSIPSFHTYLEQVDIDKIRNDSRFNESKRKLITLRLHEMKKLFGLMKCGANKVKTSIFARKIQLNNYMFETQHDAQEALSDILETCFPYYDSEEDGNHSMFRIQFEQIMHCNKNRNGCGSTERKFIYDHILSFHLEDTDEPQHVYDALIKSFDTDTSDEYRCNLGENGGCKSQATCTKSLNINELGEILIIQLIIYKFDNYGRRKLFPNLVIDQELDQYRLQGVIWHHGQNIDAGHYTSMVKHNGCMYHLSDAEQINKYDVRYYCTPDMNMVPYLLFYAKNDISNADFSRSTIESTNSNIRNDENFITQPNKRRLEPMDDNVGTDTKRIFVGENPDTEDICVIHDASQYVEDDDSGKEILENINKKKYNFSKRKTKYSSRNTLAKKRLREMPAGLEKSRIINKEANQKMRGTPEGLEKSRKIDKEAKHKMRGTPEGLEKSRIINKEVNQKMRGTPEGLERNRNASEKLRNAMRNAEKDRISNLPFPPKITDGIEKQCIDDFIDVTSPRSMESVECGICAQAVLKKDINIENNTFLIHELPSRELLLLENQENPDDYLDEYLFEDVLLSPGGVNDDQSVLCCQTCLSSLKRERLPKFSVANDFQIGKTPDELKDLTLPEKLLISKFRPKMYVVKLKSIAGPHTSQNGLKGNTITFPQNIPEMASSLPANPEILVDHIKVVFIGKSKPTIDLLKKVLTVRREKVYNALSFLIANNPIYQDVTLSDVNLPLDDIPQEIKNSIEFYDDPDNEEENEHSTYTPQTDLDNIPSDSIIMDSVGLIDLEGSSVKANDQICSAIRQLNLDEQNDESNEVNFDSHHNNDCDNSNDNDNTYQGTVIMPHGPIPVIEYSNPTLWLGAYPWLFPYGKGGPETKRKVYVGLRAYIKHLLKLADRKFSLDLSLKFHAFNVIQKRDVSYHTSLHVSRPGFNTTAAHIDSLSQESMNELLNCVESRTPITNPSLKSLMNSLSSTGKFINGSPYQKSTYRREIFGLMIKEGSPVLWITLSPAVSHSPIFLQIAGYVVDLESIPTHAERAKIVANDPVAAAIFFNEIIDNFTKYLLGYKKIEGGIFGHPSAYYGMTEEQGTGTLHNHMLVWLHNFRSTSKLRAELENETFRNDLIGYLERIIKQGFIGRNNIEEDVDVSDISFRYPSKRESPEFENDVNKLVKVANTHSCRGTCYKYRKTKECRFEFPRELVPVSKVEGIEIKLKRTHEMVNNYNPSLMTCLRSNHDIKFIPSGKDGKNIAFYVTNYATKSQLSTNNIVPLIAASKKKLEEHPSMASSNIKAKAKMMITKCLNRITTETEISGAHVSHFLLGFHDKNTSHKFAGLDLHSALAWLAKEIKSRDDCIEENDQETNENISMDKNSIETTAQNIDQLENRNIDNDSEEDDSDDENISFRISSSNEGFVLVNQMTDYLNRGEDLKEMCLWEYRSKVYKERFTEEKLKKQQKKEQNRKQKRERGCVQRFLTTHPQSETHWQKIRTENSAMVPSLSKLPPSSNNNKTKFEKCMLLIFKPFTTFEDLYNGNSWDESYADFLETTNYNQYIENLEELHVGIEEKHDCDDNSDEVIDENDDEEGEDNSISDNTDKDNIDSQTVEALDVIKNTNWLDESTSNHQSNQNRQNNLNSSFIQYQIWQEDMKKQNQDKMDNVGEMEEIEDHSPMDGIALPDQPEVDIDFSVEKVNTPNAQEEKEKIEKIRENIGNSFTLNKKQMVAYKMATDNVIKRHLKEKTEQLIGYVGGPGGTGKSQVIKAIVKFHEEMKLKKSLKMCANTGTAAKHIGGNTTTTLFGFCSKKSEKLQLKFEKVETIIVDEISMIGCLQLVRISKSLSKGKCVDPSIPFGGVDMLFFGDFIQFPPVKDNPLYSGWKNSNTKSNTRAAEIDKQLGIHLWKQVNKIVLLSEQMRCTDDAYRNLLNRLRVGECTDQDVEMLNRRIVGHSVDITSIVDTPIITPGNQLVMAINELFVNHYSQLTKIYVSTAVDYIGRKNNRKQVPKNVAARMKNWANTATRGLPRELKMFIGMPVIVTTNIATELGITNGTTGIVRSMHFKEGEVINEETGYHQFDQPPEYIIVELEGISMETLDGLPPNHVPIFLKTESFQVKLPGKKKGISVNRHHFPLVPRFSCTAHKSQGQTLRKAIVDLVPRNGKTKGIGIEFAYVPLSRVRRLDDLTILRPFDPAILKAKVNDGCKYMMEEYSKRDLCKDI